jgi:hypothetical protein
MHWPMDCFKGWVKSKAGREDAMASCPQDTVLMRVLFSHRKLAKPALEDWGRDRMVAVSWLRGRFTSKDAYVDLEVRGVAQKIARFMAQISVRVGTS